MLSSVFTSSAQPCILGIHPGLHVGVVIGFDCWVIFHWWRQHKWFNHHIVKYGYFEYFFWGHGRYFNLILNVLRSHWRILNRRVTWSNLCCQLLFKSLYRELPQSISVLWRWLLGSVNWKNAQPTSWELCLIQQTYWRHKLGRWPLIALRDFSKEVREELGYAGVFAKTNKQTNKNPR